MRIMSIFKKSSVPIWLASLNATTNIEMEWIEFTWIIGRLYNYNNICCIRFMLWMFVEVMFVHLWISSSVSAYRWMRKMKRKCHIYSKLELISSLRIKTFSMQSKWISHVVECFIKCKSNSLSWDYVEIFLIIWG